MTDEEMICAAPQALKSSKEVELVDDKIRCKTEPERWPIPTPTVVGSPRTDFSQLINCPEFVPRQTLSSSNSGQYSAPWPQLLLYVCCSFLAAVLRIS